MTDVDEAAARVDPASDAPWRRLDPRMLVVGPLAGLVRLVPVIAVLLFAGRGEPARIWVALAIAGLLILTGTVRWRTTRYRITEDRVELHSGWLRRQRRSVPRDRIRTVDLTAKLLHRVFGLSVVRVSAASGSGLEQRGLSLDAVSTAEAERLRRKLLERPAPAAPRTADPVPTVSEPPAEPPAMLLARLHWSWLRFAPLTFSALAGIGAVMAALHNLLDDLGVDPRDVPAVDDATDRLVSAPVWVGVGVVGALLLVVAVIGSVVLFAERWWDYRLTREPDGTLRVLRGLLTRRSLSVSEERLRGAAISEPLLLRAGRGAQCHALSTGLGRDTQGGALQPPAPRAEAHRVASAALREHPLMITRAPLLRHPRAALLRRLSRAVVPAAVLVAGAWLLGALGAVPSWLGPASLVLLPLAVLLGLDRYRNLGHTLTGRYLVTRLGSVRRRTVALQRSGVIGWTLRQSVFQRRSGLVTVEAVTAAGEGGYHVLDVDAADGVALADAATPGLLTPFRAGPTAARSHRPSRAPDA
ncbi:PH domain-containing protein [Pseudonocardia sp. H11422]|uniref:PH domain-containing protein n=1 Tax=Pseudonocardia sp. H11422 TaxID=2835866 RepID=UPI001BDD2920|nr:PH domain-containing protein [Pseudonocardia sp. H11422]